MISPEHGHDEREKESEWMKSERQMQELYTRGITGILEALPDRGALFEDGESCLCCMDEGVQEGRFRAAGSGILLDDAQRREMIARLKEQGVEGVKSHAGCGAAEKYKQDHGIDRPTDEVAIEKAKALAAELGVAYLGHVDHTKRPKDFHNARVVYYDGTGRFNQQQAGDALPPGFVVTRRLMGSEAALADVKLALAIATGTHGFGKKITAEKPFVFVALGDDSFPEFSTEALRAELEGLASQIATEQPGIVRIDAVPAPLSIKPLSPSLQTRPSPARGESPTPLSRLGL